MINNITVGSDPEFFILKVFEDEVIPIPAYEIIPGSKEDPIDFGGSYKVLVDNVLVEGNIPPAKEKEEFVYNMKKLKTIINEHFLAELRCTTHAADSYEFEPEQLQDHRAKEFGCAPFIDAWSRENVYIRNLKSNIRSCGNHIHVGYNLENSKFTKKEVNIAMTRAFDFFVILPSEKIHKDEFRSKHYGGYGKMRHTSYGVEFRSLGGFFTQDQYLGGIYEGVMDIVKFCQTDENIERLLNMTKDDLKTINLKKELEIIIKEKV